MYYIRAFIIDGEHGLNFVYVNMLRMTDCLQKNAIFTKCPLYMGTIPGRSLVQPSSATVSIRPILIINISPSGSNAQERHATILESC